MQSVKLPDLPIPTSTASAIMINSNIYVYGGFCDNVVLARQVQVYDVNHNVWSTLLHTPQYGSQGVAINSRLVLIGGYEAVSEGITNLVSTWTGQEWQQDLPPMPTKRGRPGVTTYHTFVVIAGGMAEDRQTLLISIDILNINTRQWWTPANLQLPRPMFDMQCAISNAHLSVVRASISHDVATDTGATVKNVWQLPVTALEKVLITGEDVTPHKWTEVAPPPYFNSAILQDTTHIVAVGGNGNSGEPMSDIFVYNPDRNVWSKVGQLGVPRTRCSVVSLNGTSFIVCGGCTDASDRKALLASVEVVHV